MGTLEDIKGWADRAEEVPPREPDLPPEPPAEDDRGSGLPAGCPVEPLGRQGTISHYLDALGQHIFLDARDHSRNNIIGLYCGDPDLAWSHFPRWATDKATGERYISGFRAEVAADALQGACGRIGVWSPFDKIRGLGAWCGPEGELILHLGDKILVRPLEAWSAATSWESVAPGRLANRVYPTGAPLHRPHAERQAGGPDGPGAKLLAILRTWNWRRGELDAYLMLGFIAAGMLGGAADWRPIAWVTGDFSTGKSTLQHLIKWLYGDDGLVQSPDATEAAVRQVLGCASVPVLVDEAEPDDRGRMDKLVKLARNAATGSLGIRGGANGVAAQYVIRSTFLFGSIVVPPLPRQDKSRIALLELDRLAPGEKPAGMTERAMGELGQRLLRRLVDQWPRLADTLQLYRATMGAAGYSARSQDLYGALLAAADLLLHDAAPASDDEEAGAEAWVKKLTAAGVLDQLQEEEAYNECLNYLLSQPLDAPSNRQRLTIGHWIARAMGRVDGLEMDGRELCKRHLLLVGLKIVLFEGREYLAIANRHSGLAALFRETQWAGREGLEGGWAQALRRVEGHLVPKKAMWFGNASKGTLLPIALCLPGGDTPSSAALPQAMRSADDPDPSPDEREPGPDPLELV